MRTRTMPVCLALAGYMRISLLLGGKVSIVADRYGSSLHTHAVPHSSMSHHLRAGAAGVHRDDCLQAFGLLAIDTDLSHYPPRCHVFVSGFVVDPN